MWHNHSCPRRICYINRPRSWNQKRYIECEWRFWTDIKNPGTRSRGKSTYTSVCILCIYFYTCIWSSCVFIYVFVSISLWFLLSVLESALCIVYLSLYLSVYVTCTCICILSLYGHKSVYLELYMSVHVYLYMYLLVYVYICLYMYVLSACVRVGCIRICFFVTVLYISLIGLVLNI